MSTNPDPISIKDPYLSYMIPRGKIKKIAIALGTEYRRLNFGTLMLWIC
jgi:hypothetical protein